LSISDQWHCSFLDQYRTAKQVLQSRNALRKMNAWLALAPLRPALRQRVDSASVNVVERLVRNRTILY